MNDLLFPLALDIMAKGRGRVPMFFEFDAPTECTPFLISSSLSLLWVESPQKEGRLRAGVRRTNDKESLYTEVLHEVASLGRAQEWGNVGPYTGQGIRDAVLRLDEYGLGAPDVLVSTADEDSGFVPSDWTPKAVGWVPKGWAIVLPQDRSLLGLLGSVSPTHFVIAVHNANRALMILTPESDYESQPVAEDVPVRVLPDGGGGKLRSRERSKRVHSAS